MTVPALSHGGPWTERDLLALPEDGQRHELVEGSLLMSPPPAGWHQLVAFRLTRLLEEAAPQGLRAVEALGVRIPGEHPSVLVPDVLVAEGVAVAGAESGILDPAAIRLVVEIVSPGSATRDRVYKPALYARAGIPAFWRVEREAGRLAVVTFRLEGGEYAEEGCARSGELLRVQRPFPLHFDPAGLDPS